MKRIWVSVNQWSHELVTAAIEGGADGLVLPEGYSESVKELGRVVTIAKDGDLIPEIDVVFSALKTAEDIGRIVRVSKVKIVVVECDEWTIIPLENIVAEGGDGVVVQVQNLEDAQVALSVLEKGVGGVLIRVSSVVDLRKILRKLISSNEEISLSAALVESVTHVGVGDRVCVDTCTSMLPGQGMLVGNSSSFFFLMHAECITNPYVEQRPFRINAGAVHAYTRVSGGKTKYLSELLAGSKVEITDYLGRTEIAIVGRVKIEKRPMLLINATCGDCSGTIIVQNAETIRLVSTEGVAKSVVELQSGDEIVVMVEAAGRHFGYKIEESIDER